ncbi:hypothetical protein BC628DRAFT_1342594 [Trametes gibbosa]|nr:hypothetical protein BC628DRAFT_1342594 [Trametes gibbosa]
MNVQQHAAIVILESIRVLTVDTAGARSLTHDASLTNAVHYSIIGAITTLSAWINAISKLVMQLGDAPFDDSVAVKVIIDLTTCVHAYTELMIALVEKHDVLTSPSSPLAPDGVAIGDALIVFQFVFAVYQIWFRRFIPTRRAELDAQADLAADAALLASARYPISDGLAGAKAFEAVCGKRNLPELPK